MRAFARSRSRTLRYVYRICLCIFSFYDHFKFKRNETKRTEKKPGLTQFNSMIVSQSSALLNIVYTHIHTPVYTTIQPVSIYSGQNSRAHCAYERMLWPTENTIYTSMYELMNCWAWMRSIEMSRFDSRDLTYENVCNFLLSNPKNSTVEETRQYLSPLELSLFQKNA